MCRQVGSNSVTSASPVTRERYKEHLQPRVQQKTHSGYCLLLVELSSRKIRRNGSTVRIASPWKRNMEIPPFLAKSLLLMCALAGSLCLGVQSLSGQSAISQEPGASAEGRLEDAEQRAGPFAIAGQNYTVVLHEKRLANVSDPIFARSLTDVEIADAAGNISYQKAFSYAIEQGRFARGFSASAQLASGNTGTGLLIYYREQTPASPTSALQTRESWQLFGFANGRLAPLGKPAPIGQGMTGGPFMGVMMRAANGAVSVIGQPDAIEVRAWTGYFYVFVPLRVDWSHGGLAQGQRCMEMIGGGLKEVGCDMRVEAVRKPPTDEFTFARLFVEANENLGSVEHVVVQKDSKVEILGARAITTWNENDELIQPIIADVWLHVRIDDRAGWIQGEEDFSAVGLPATSPAP